MTQDFLNKELRYVKGVGPRIFEKLSHRGLRTVKDALYFFPRNYQDRRTITDIGSIEGEGFIQVAGKISLSREIRFSGGRRCYEVIVEDESGVISLKWLHYRLKQLNSLYREKRSVLVFGYAKLFRGRYEFLHPDVSFISDYRDREDRDIGLAVIPVYPEIQGIYKKTVQKIILNTVREYAHLVDDPLPHRLLKTEGLPPLSESIERLHLPGDIEGMDEYLQFNSRYHRRVVFDQLFFLQLGIAMKKQSMAKKECAAIPWDRKIVAEIKKRLPFDLTDAQKRTINEILGDMKKNHPMNRLLQGDVGSGKTIVSWIASIIAWYKGYQVAIMAPTEILSEQHFRNFKTLSKGLPLQIGHLTSSTPSREKASIKEKMSTGDMGIVIGTHALIQEDVTFRNLALVIVDEQHRFGVYQRVRLREKGLYPHLLVMTATPIPRSLAMTLYGDLDVSLIDQMPPGRSPVVTRIVREDERGDLYDILRKEIEAGGRVYAVYPLVMESEKMDLKDATKMYEHLKHNIFPNTGVELLHGRMRPEEKELAIKRFREGVSSILVTTTVIEVGVDVPSATVMLIEHPERFGLSQLHQLRGRVGRSDKASYCYLMAGDRISEDGRKRLEVMEKTNDGFQIAEEDLKIRGPGDYLGSRQSGFPDILFGNLISDSHLLKKARDLAFSKIDEDPELTGSENRKLRNFVKSNMLDSVDFTFA